MADTNTQTQVPTPPPHSGLKEKMDIMEGKHMAPPPATDKPFDPASAAQAQQTPAAVVPETPEAAPVAPATTTSADDDEELTEEEEARLLKKLEKKTGRKINVDELKEPVKQLTAAELAELAEQEKAAALEWALGTQKITKDLYDKSVIEKSKDKREIALKLFTEEAQAEDKTLTDDDCAQLFSDFYAEEEPETSFRRKKLLAQMNQVADNYLSQYNTIDGITEEYRSFKTTAEAQKSYDKRVKAVAKEMPADISYKVPFTSTNGATEEVEYKIPVDPKILAQVAKEFATVDLFERLGEEKPDRIAKEMQFMVKARMMDEIVPALLRQHEEKVAEDIMVNLKNARNPNQPLNPGIHTPSERRSPPAHTGLKSKIG